MIKDDILIRDDDIFILNSLVALHETSTDADIKGKLKELVLNVFKRYEEDNELFTDS